MPLNLSPLPKRFLDALPALSFQEICLELTSFWLKVEFERTTIEKIVSKAFPFEAPIKRLKKNLYVLELFHGPTLAFKDFGARFMAQVLSGVATEFDRQLTILVATSGDTGSAVANAFHQVPGVRVVLLFPSGKISDIQRKQMTTLGENIIALAVDGVFDDCQRLVKQVFLDDIVTSKLQITSANSINIARLLPQSFYYFAAVGQIENGVPPIFSVPSGNFGNLTAGLIAKSLGLSVDHFVAATNSNDVVPQYMQTGRFKPRNSIQTISNAMDVGNPSNFERMLDLYGNDVNKMKREIYGVAFSDSETRNCILEVFQDTNYVLDPHGAVAYLGLRKYLSENSDQAEYPAVFLETAHPAKFPEIVKPIIRSEIDLPERLKKCLDLPEYVISISPQFEKFRSFLMDLES